MKQMHEVKPRTRIMLDDETLQKLERIRRGKQ